MEIKSDSPFPCGGCHLANIKIQAVGGFEVGSHM